MAHKLSDVDTPGHPHNNNTYVTLEVRHGSHCYMSLTGVVLGTVLSKEGVAAVADSILAVPSIYTSDIATDCAWMYSGMRCGDTIPSKHATYVLTVTVGVGPLHVCTGGCRYTQNMR